LSVQDHDYIRSILLSLRIRIPVLHEVNSGSITIKNRARLSCIELRYIVLTPTALIIAIIILFPYPQSAAHGDRILVECDVVGGGGDLARLRGIRFSADEDFDAIEVRMDGRVGGVYEFNAELRRSSGFTGVAEATSGVISISVPGTHNNTPFPVVHIDFPRVAASPGETFTLKFAGVSGPSDLFFEVAGIGNFPCPNVEETEFNTSENPVVRSDPTGFRVLAGIVVDATVPEFGIETILFSTLILALLLLIRRRHLFCESLTSLYIWLVDQSSRYG